MAYNPADPDHQSNGDHLYCISAPPANFPITLVILTLSFPFILWFLASGRTPPQLLSLSSSRKWGSFDTEAKYMGHIPITVTNSSENITKTLQTTLDKYERECQATLEMLSQSMSLARQTEDDEHLPHILSNSIEKRIGQLAEAYQRNQHVLKQLLRPFPTVMLLADGGRAQQQAGQKHPSTRNQSMPTTHHTLYNNILKGIDPSANAYNDGAQIFVHLVRDWSEAGKTVRHSLYDWCVAQLKKHLVSDSSNPGAYPTIVVPGAGLGRLAYDLAHAFPSASVHGLDVSTSMVAAFFRLTSGYSYAVNELCNENNEFSIYPYVMDPWSNEVDSQERYTPVTISLPPQPITDRISMTLTPWESYDVPKVDAIVTCFVLDTAHNLYQSIRQARRLLQESESRIWVNIGPLQWHSTTQLFPSADDIQNILLADGQFTIFHWSVDEKPVTYREENGPRSTRYEGYLPLRWVVKLN